MDLQRRIEVFRIDAAAREDVRAVAPVLRRNLTPIAQAFYNHFLACPEGREVFARPGVLEHARRMQIAHWRDLLSLELNQAYVARSIAMGRAHEHVRVPPFLFVAGYQLFLERAEALIRSEHAHVPAAITARRVHALHRVVMLDLELSLSAFMRELARQIAPH